MNHAQFGFLLRIAMVLFILIRPWLVIAVMCCAALGGQSALAWGQQAHHTVVLIAQSQLTPRTQAMLQSLLLEEPGANLQSISTWADTMRSPETATWHYVNFPQNSCTYESARDCPQGQCVVAALEKQLQLLTSNAPRAERLQALKFVVHLAADVHQPLHAGFAHDRGGNRVSLKFFMRDSNLHTLWDTGLPERIAKSPKALAHQLNQANWPRTLGDHSPRVAAEESCRIVRTPGFYPDALVGTAYLERFAPVVRQRLWTAGVRLAHWLNQAMLVN